MWMKGESRSKKLRIRVNFEREEWMSMIVRSLVLWSLKEIKGEWGMSGGVGERKYEFITGNREIVGNTIWGWLC